MRMLGPARYPPRIQFVSTLGEGRSTDQNSSEIYAVRTIEEDDLR